MTNRFSITTLGCKVNQYESDAIASHLLRSGWTKPSPGQSVDLCIVNTCTVTGKASMQSRQAVRKAIQRHPEATVVVTGCYAQTEAEALAEITGVDLIVGHGDKHRILDILEDSGASPNQGPKTIQTKIQAQKTFQSFEGPALGSRTRPFLKIQDGCDSFCSYCIVPYARGPSRSLPANEIMDRLFFLGSQGYQEVVITGVHLGNYGVDLDPTTTLAALLRQIVAHRPIHRIRLSSIEPHELTGEIIQMIKDTHVFCHHLHIPLQSGDDTVLSRMRRPYTNSYFQDLVNQIHHQLPEAAIGADVLIGFPGETDKAFNNTVELIEALPVSYLHVFPYSSRPRTPASHFPDPVAPGIIKERSEQMRKLGEDKKHAFLKKLKGRSLEVLVETTRDPSSGCLKGVSSNYVKVLLDGPDSLKNTLVAVPVDGKTRLYH